VAKAETNIPEQEEESSDDGGIVEEQVCNEGAPGWVVTFGDMMSLLLTFFYSSSLFCKHGSNSI